MAPPKGSRDTEFQKQVAQTWDLAKQQLQRLRDQVERTSQLASLKAKTDHIHSEKDRALRNLGDAVWREVQRGLKLPAACSAALDQVKAADRKAEDQAGEIADLLAVETVPASRPRRTGKKGKGSARPVRKKDSGGRKKEGV